MWEYIVKAAAAWLLGFAPFVEIYIAIPVAVAMGLDYVSAVVWSVFGNFAPVPLIVLWYEKLLQRKRLGAWLKRLSSGRGRRILDRHGPWFLIVVTPWIGIWPVAAAARALGMPRARVMLYSFISVTIHGVLLAVLIAMGVDWFTGHDSHRKPSTNESKLLLPFTPAASTAGGELEVGNSGLYLLSDMSSGVTGRNVHVDAGFNIMGL